jgi:Ser/Thr protein kinase RdoA (MazF antagonist)
MQKLTKEEADMANGLKAMRKKRPLTPREIERLRQLERARRGR